MQYRLRPYGEQALYQYSYEDNPTTGLITNVVDGNPLTYFEYEAISLSRSSIYSKNAKPKEFMYSYEKRTDNSFSIDFKSWIDHPQKESLKLVLGFRAASASMVNSISVYPFWGTDQNATSQIKVTRITALTEDLKEVDLINGPLYVGSSVVPLTFETSKNYFYDRLQVSFSEIKTSQILVYFEQQEPTDVKIKHMFWKPIGATGPFASLNTQSRFDETALGSLGFTEVEVNVNDLIPPITRPNVWKDQSDFFIKKLNIAYKNQEQVEVYIVSFTKDNRKYYYTNIATGFEDFDKQQEKSRTPNIDLAWASETRAGAERIVSLIEGKIDREEWLEENFEDIKIETKKATYEPKRYAASIDLKRDFEIYDAKRWSIGLRSVDASYEYYDSQASFVSKSYNYSGKIKYLTLSMDYQTDFGFTSQEDSSIKTYISVDEGKNWYRISAVENPFIGVPEVLAFNVNVEESKKVKGVRYLNSPAVPANVNKVRVKVEIFKERYSNISPIINSYKLIAKVEKQ